MHAYLDAVEGSGGYGKLDILHHIGVIKRSLTGTL